MFGLFKRKGDATVPDEPIQMSVSIEIEKAADDVYALLDFGDERHQLRARGSEIREISGDPRTYRLWYDLTPDMNYLFTVTEAVPGRSYAYSASIVPQIGLRTGSHEAYAIEPISIGSCRLTIVNTINHAPGMNRRQLDAEIAKSSQAVANSLTKLKIQAEQGVEAVEEFERQLGHR